MIRRAAKIKQRMLILRYYQRLYLFLLFYSGQSNHPLLAIYTSKLLSKPNTPPYALYIIYEFYKIYNIFYFFYLHLILVYAIILYVSLRGIVSMVSTMVSKTTSLSSSLSTLPIKRLELIF